jgi:hypothetical protein
MHNEKIEENIEYKTNPTLTKKLDSKFYKLQ